ncbi:MAG: hypothetical protein MH132_08305 [Hydrotalea sp.]|nr:hypothetical protein [Hydrotalea sp.]
MEEGQYPYIVTLKRKSFFWPDTLARLMMGLALVVFLVEMYVSFPSTLSYILIGSLVISAWIVYFQHIVFRHEIVTYKYALFTLGFAWLFLPQYAWVGVFFIAAALLEKQVKFPEEIGFDDTGVTFNTFPKKEVKWASIEHIVLKDGLLTIQYKNNSTFFQQPVDEAVSHILENEFNEYCLEQLQQGN